MQRTEQGYLDHLYFRELPVDARQHTVSEAILCEQCTENQKGNAKAIFYE